MDLGLSRLGIEEYRAQLFTVEYEVSVLGFASGAILQPAPEDERWPNSQIR